MFFALALFLCLLVITYKIAVLKGIKHAEWVVILTGLQPILFDISYACMTEMPAAFMITLSYWYYIKGKYGWSMATASLVLLCRTEMFIFACLMFIVYLWKREWKLLPLVLVGPLLWIGSTAIISGNIMTFFREWSYFSNLGKFIPGTSVTHYFENLHTAYGVAQVLLFIAGVIYIARVKKITEYMIIYSTIALTLILHTIAAAEVFHWTGSIGELRYITVVGPFFGIVSVVGLSDIFERLKLSWWRFVFSVIVFGVVVFNCTLTTHPRRWPNYEQVVINMTKALRNGYPELTLLSNDCTVAYVMDVAPSGGPHFAKLNENMLKKYPECLILWDPFSSSSIYSQTKLTKEKMLSDTTVKVLERYKYWNVEYLVLYKK